MTVVQFPRRAKPACCALPGRPPGDTAETLRQLPDAAAGMRSALEMVEGLYQSSQPDSVAEYRYTIAAEHLEQALAELEWTPEEQKDLDEYRRSSEDAQS